MLHDHYKKSWLVLSSIARDLLVQQSGDRIPSVKEYTEKLHSSRGIVQNAFQTLQQEGAITLEKRGKMGSYIAAADISKLFQLADLNFITGSMPTPLSDHLAGLATGICHTMNICPVPFTFAFIQGSGNRIVALQRMVYDFVVVSKATALYHIAQSPDLSIAMTLTNCDYSLPYVICTKDPQFTGIKDGMKIAADLQSTDQYVISEKLAENKNVELLHCPYTSTGAYLLSDKVDLIVYRDEEWLHQQEGIYFYSIDDVIHMDEYLVPTVLVNKNNYGISDILKNYLHSDLISERQQAVVSKEMMPQFY